MIDDFAGDFDIVAKLPSLHRPAQRTASGTASDYSTDVISPADFDFADSLLGAISPKLRESAARLTTQSALQSPQMMRTAQSKHREDSEPISALALVTSGVRKPRSATVDMAPSSASNGSLGIARSAMGELSVSSSLANAAPGSAIRQRTASVVFNQPPPQPQQQPGMSRPIASAASRRPQLVPHSAAGLHLRAPVVRGSPADLDHLDIMPVRNGASSGQRQRQVIGRLEPPRPGVTRERSYGSLGLGLAGNKRTVDNRSPQSSLSAIPTTAGPGPKALQRQREQQQAAEAKRPRTAGLKTISALGRHQPTRVGDMRYDAQAQRWLRADGSDGNDDSDADPASGAAWPAPLPPLQVQQQQQQQPTPPPSLSRNSSASIPFPSLGLDSLSALRSSNIAASPFMVRPGLTRIPPPSSQQATAANSSAKHRRRMSHLRGNMRYDPAKMRWSDISEEAADVPDPFAEIEELTLTPKVASSAKPATVEQQQLRNPSASSLFVVGVHIALALALYTQPRLYNTLLSRVDGLVRVVYLPCASLLEA
ncbi:hypothetical protein GQ42DRAFT_180614 [Ramicandelaber brevisporus]|nr:hypothetical protein GQ42DRAFT_180614 [Ramicandelaber brevisporus]